ncbi:hypothetical protein EDC04DRAFT_2611449 [Pisolithus marmoratus]|nr:hypothetical protein EDC04DRAFT_2611449 [Pisolithus marmoratus]
MDISQKVDYLPNTMQLLQITLPQFILGLLSSKKHKNDHIVLNFTLQINNIIEIVNKYSETGKKNIQALANKITMKTYVSKIETIAAEGSGLHFNAAHANVQQLEEFDIDDLAWKMKADAPYLWETLGEALLTHEEWRMGTAVVDNQRGEDGEDEYYDTLEGCNINLGEPTGSILVQNTNQKANYLQCMLGIFLQSAHTPQKVVETLTQMGLSISVTLINAAILLLSKESNHTIKSLGHMMLMAYAYDNFDVDLKTSDQQVKKSNDTLKHLTSSLLFPLQHGTSLDDLCYLVEHRPAYFQQFKDMVGEPEFIKAIPVVKMPIIAACMMEFVNSTVSGNIQSITGLLAQARIHDPKDKDDPDMPDISDYVVLFHGDLGTAEHVQAILQCWAVEDSPWNQCQYVIFIPGLFHLKMAATDALWHAFIHPAAASHDDTSLMHDIGILQPKETGIYQSKPRFRHMHQLITYSGVCQRLDCWWSEVANLDLRLRTLEAFVDTMPMFTQVKDIANTIAHKYVTTNALERVCQKPSSQHDMQLENALIINKYMLLYEELMHVMNISDIGRFTGCHVLLDAG